MSKKGFFLGCLLLASWFAQAQVRIQLELPFARQMPAYLSEWEQNESLIRILISNTTPVPLEALHVAGYLEWEDGRRLATIAEGHQAQPRFNLESRETRSFSWRELINLDALDYDRSWLNRIATGGTLPEGSYQLCLYVLDAKGQRLGQTEPCGQLAVILPDPPQLLSPADGAIIDPSQGLPLFHWTPTTPQLPGTIYRLVIKPVFPGQTPEQALQANPMLFLYETTATSYQYLPSDPDLGEYTDAIGLVWQVQALVNGQPYARNDGLSAPAVFGLATAVSPTNTTTISLDVIGWDVPYESLIAGEPVTLEAQLPEDIADTLFYVLRIKIPSYPPKYALFPGRRDPVILDIDGDNSQNEQQTQGVYPGGYYLFGLQPDDSLGQARTGYTGGFFLYRLPEDTTQPASLIGFVHAKNWAHEVRKEISAQRQIAYNAGKEGAIIVERNGQLLAGTFRPTHLLLPLYNIVVEPTEGGEPPVCNLPGNPSNYNAPNAEQMRYTGYVLNQAIASGAGRASGRTLGAVTRQTSPQRPGKGTVVAGRIERGKIKLNEPVDIVGLREAKEAGIEDTQGEGARYTGYVLNQAIASGAGRASGRTLGAVTRQAPSQPDNPAVGNTPEPECPPNAKCAPPISNNRPVAVAAAEAAEASGGIVICWLPPVDPDRPWVGVAGHLDEDEDALVFTWSGPRPKGGQISALVRIQ